MTSFLGKKTCRKDVVLIVTFDLIIYWFTSHQSHYCLYYNGIPEFVSKCFNIKRKIAQTKQNIGNFIVRESNLQKMATLAIIREISDSNLETGRNNLKSGVSRIIRES